MCVDPLVRVLLAHGLLCAALFRWRSGAQEWEGEEGDDEGDEEDDGAADCIQHRSEF